MASIQRQASSGSDGSATMVDERKRKRMLSNRESARRSRMRKQKQLEDLTGETSRLQMAINQIQQSINAKEQAYVQVESANNVLRAQAMELTDRLRSLNFVLQIVEDVISLSVEDETKTRAKNTHPWPPPKLGKLPTPLATMADAFGSSPKLVSGTVLQIGLFRLLGFCVGLFDLLI